MPNNVFYDPAVLSPEQLEAKEERRLARNEQARLAYVPHKRQLLTPAKKLQRKAARDRIKAFHLRHGHK